METIYRGIAILFVVLLTAYTYVAFADTFIIDAPDSTGSISISLPKGKSCIEVSDCNGETTTTTTTTVASTTTTTTIPSNTIFYQDFEGIRPSDDDYVVSVNEAEDMFGGQSWSVNGNPYKTWAAGNGVLVTDPVSVNNTSLEMKYWYGMYALGKTDSSLSGVQARPSGISAYMDANIPDDLDEFTFSISLYVPVGFTHNWAAHMPSIKSASSVSASTDPSLFGKTLSATFQIASPDPFPGSTSSNFKLADFPGTLSIYYYNAEGHQLNKFYNPKDPASPHSSGRGIPLDESMQLIEGAWNHLKMYVKLNTKGFAIGDPAGANGILRVWHNNQLMIDITDMQWRNDRNRTITFSRSQIQLWYGGNDMRWAAHEDQSWLIDNIGIWRGLH